ncbi:choice-of-anchor L domain-containing protein [Mesoflavibacter profundi]|uniref:Choice-of-anchor L domain-containing protein n=2 Tax=Mesoflavibacter profundi TaxID=2708110 RepID=A0ABT4S2N4_9FLAO|nr:choice-of-anchor L domain-containing protein [Mesoflavibacter profundi]MDA0178309.1 choice-of-anchor L domain-containing protein [Mesoflavibacter profundi]
MKKLLLSIFTFLVTLCIYSQDINMQNGTFSQCSGVLYDSGGGSANYANDENFVLTICPDGPDQFIQLDFTLFSTQLNLDILTVYDGDDTSAPVIGTFSGGGAANNPGTISASTTSATGCLTLEFVSDGSGNTLGWAADISCLQSCQVITPTIDSTTPAANGAGVVEIPLGGTVDFEGSAIFEVDGAGATYSWNFGDATVGSGQNVSHTYNNIGTYTVTFTVTDTNPTGCSAFYQIDVVVLSPYIDVDQTTYTVDQLVTDVLIDSPCASVSNINWSTGTNFGQENGIGYFSALPGAFPFEAGIVLNSGDAMEAEGPETGTQSSGGWPGDADLEAAIPSLTNSNDASFIEFDFVPIANSISFDFLFASEEYGTFQCSFTDAFAFLLTDLSTGITTNLALVPGTTDVVSVYTVRDNTYNNGCNSVNPQYFDSYYGAGGLPTVNDPINFRGYTTSMTAFSAVTPNNNYRIKLVIADAFDTAYNAAVFLGAGTFDLGGDLGDDVTIAAGTAVCAGGAITLDTGLTTATHTWYYEGDVIPGETGPVISATQDGNYSVDIVYSASCQTSDSIYIEFIPGPTIENTIDLTVCDVFGGPETFDLTLNDSEAIGTQDPTTVTVSYFNSLADAQNDINEIANPSAYITSGAYPETIFIRIEDNASQTCVDTSSFTLDIFSTIINPAPDMVQCDDMDNDGFMPFDLETQTPLILGTQPASNYEVTYHTSFADADGDVNALMSPYTNVTNPEPIYVRIEVIGDASCYNVTTTPLFNLIVNLNDDSSYTVTPTCDGATVSNVTTPGGTFSSPTGATIDPVTGLVTGAASGATHSISYTTTGACPTTTTVDFTVLVTDDPSFTLQPTCDGAVVDSEATPGSYAFNPIPGDGATIDTATGTILNATPGATYTVEHTTNGVCPASSTATVTVYPLEDASFVPTATCDGATVTITGDTGGTFVLNPDPGSPITIDSVTGTVTGGTYGDTYTIEYTTGGPCPEVSAQNVTVLAQDDPSFTMVPNCDGGTVDSVAMPGGTYTFNPPAPSGDTVQIDASTGAVTMATPGTSYTVEYTTATQCPATSTFVLNVLPADNSSFNLDPTCDGATATVTGLSGGTFVLTTTGATIDAATGTVTGALPGSVHTVEYTTNGPCPTTTTQNVTVHPEVIAIDPTPLEVCDDNTPDGITQIDLTLKDTEVTGGVASYVASYYLTLTDAETATNPLPIPYTNLTNPQLIYVRVEDANTTCYDTTTLELQVEQAPTAFTPTPLEYCDPDSDGFGEFMLTDADGQITGGAAGLVVTYHETMSDAENNVNALTSPYDNIVVNTQTIYVRVESQTIVTDCASYVDLQLIVNPTPQIDITPTALEECDDDTDGLVAFDLIQSNDEILNLLDSDSSNDINPSDVTISYYQTQADAQTPSNAIATPSNYTNTTPNMETIWVRVEYNATGCYKLTELDLIVNPLPVLVQPDQLNLCDYNNPGDEQEAFTLEDANAQILNGQTGITLTYYDTQLGADTADATAQIFSPYTNGPNPQTVYVRAEDNTTGCVNTITLDLRVNPLPSPVAPSPLVACDEDNDGIYSGFDLDSQTAGIINNEPNIVLSYHETQADAENGQNTLSSPYENIVENVQTIYIRAENTLTGCYTIVTMDLVVEPSPEVPVNIPDYIICDDDNDGYNQFDFVTVMTPQILGTQDPLDFTLTYHTTQAGADTGNMPIVNPGNYTNQNNPQTIYVRLESNVNGCVTTGEFEIRVEFPPVLVQPTPLEICDELDAVYYENNDGYAVFDLTVKNDEITGATASWTVSYYETSSDAQTGVNAIPDPTMYQNTVSGAQTVYVRVVDSDTGCFSLTTLTVRVLPNPTPNQNPTDLELCDDTNIVGPNDLIEMFDLTTYENVTLNGEPNVTASYYTDLDDALMGVNPIVAPTMHTNEDPANPGTAINPQTIYMRVTKGGTGCFTLVNFDITVNPLPEVSPIEDYIICELNTDEVAGFDLESKTDEILNGQDATVFTVTYHESQSDADSGINALVSPYFNITNPQEIYVNITNTITGCDVTTMFNIEVNEAAQANQSMPIYYECDDNIEFDGDPTDDQAQFDLTTQNADVLMGQDPTNYTVTYYDNLQDAEAGTNPIPTVYENTSNPQIIYVRVDNDTMEDDGTGTMVDSSVCYEVAEITLSVNPLPVVDLEANYLLCVNTNGTEVINPLVIETGLNPSDYTFEWTLNGTVVGTGSSIAPIQGGNYTVTIEDNVTGCISTDNTIVEESAPPSIQADVVTPAFADEHSIQVTATGTGISEYEFQLDGGSWYTNTPNDNTYLFNDVSGGEHTITVRDINGCGESSITVMVMDYPHYFTPNGDGYNETWQIYGISDQPDAVIYIFDRYGKLIKQLSPMGEGWDGTYNGNPLPTSDYWFTVEYREPGASQETAKKQFRAHFTLKR